MKPQPIHRDEQAVVSQAGGARQLHNISISKNIYMSESLSKTLNLSSVENAYSF